MFCRFGLSGIAAIVTIGGVVLFGEITAPVPATPCPTTTLEAIEARGQSFARSFFTAQQESDGLIIRAVEEKRPPRCLQVMGYARCRMQGPTTVGVAAGGRVVYFDVPDGAAAEIAAQPGSIACGYGDPPAEP
jgi:hypothetical protein